MRFSIMQVYIGEAYKKKDLWYKSKIKVHRWDFTDIYSFLIIKEWFQQSWYKPMRDWIWRNYYDKKYYRLWSEWEFYWFEFAFPCFLYNRDWTFAYFLKKNYNKVFKNEKDGFEYYVNLKKTFLKLFFFFEVNGEKITVDFEEFFYFDKKLYEELLFFFPTVSFFDD
jgi:hypothetical protein